MEKKDAATRTRTTDLSFYPVWFEMEQASQINTMQWHKGEQFEDKTKMRLMSEKWVTYSMRWEFHDSETAILLLLTKGGVSTTKGHRKVNRYNIWKSLWCKEKQPIQIQAE